jgi:hypothetical protein
MAELQRIIAEFPGEFERGYKSGFTGEDEATCDQGGYPFGFHNWTLDRRNAWWAGFNQGNCRRPAA